MIPEKSPQSSLNVLHTPFCGELRSKRYFMIDGLPSEESDFLDGSGHCWCYHTQQPIGPDGHHVGPADCRPGRECYRSGLAEPT